MWPGNSRALSGASRWQSLHFHIDSEVKIGPISKSKVQILVFFLKPTLLKRKRNSLWKQTNTYMVLAVHCNSGWNWSFQSSNPLIIGQTGFLSFRRIIIGFKRTQRIFNGLKLDCSMCFTWILSYYRFNLITESPFQFDTQMSNVNGKGTLLWIWYIISLLTIVLSNNKNNITVSVPVTKFLWGLWGGGREACNMFLTGVQCRPKHLYCVLAFFCICIVVTYIWQVSNGDHGIKKTSTNPPLCVSSNTWKR